MFRNYLRALFVVGVFARVDLTRRARQVTEAGLTLDGTIA
jgi:hypothetical protein